MGVGGGLDAIVVGVTVIAGNTVGVAESVGEAVGASATKVVVAGSIWRKTAVVVGNDSRSPERQLVNRVHTIRISQEYVRIMHLVN